MKCMARLSVFTVLAGLAWLGLPESSAAQQAATLLRGATDPVADIQLQAMQLNGDDLEVELDGRLLEDFWAQAIPITDFTQQEPVEGGVPSEKTEVRIVFDEHNLYIGAIIYDDPEGILAYQRERDAFLSTDDRFMWILDTFKDGRTGYSFEINPAGLMGDGIMTGRPRGGGGSRFGGGVGGGSSKAWDGIWEARTAMRPDGWSAEIRIPFRTLNFDPNADTWGINFQRTIRRRNEEILWRGWKRSEGLNRAIYAGELTGLRNISQGLGLEAVPSTIVGIRDIPANADPRTVPRDISLDVNYSVTPSLRASVSVNTDFAEVESDQRRVNLTRFPQRFPERRDFFLEGSGVFSFASSGGASPFYSRNIGLKSGRQVPIDFGSRLTGQVGDFEVGFYQLGTGGESFTVEGSDDLFIPSEQFTVGRVKRQFLEQSSIGAIYTRRATSADLDDFSPIDRHTAGVDLNLNSRRFAGNKNANFEAFYVWNSNPDPAEKLSTKDLSAFGARVSFPNDVWSGHFGVRQFGSDYRPSLGFVTRNNYLRIEPRFALSPRTDGISWLRRMRFHAQFRHLEELGTGRTEEQEWDINVLALDFESGDGLDFNAKHTFEYLDRSFFVSDGVEITPGEYSIWEYRIIARTTGRRKISLFGGSTFGQFWNGDRLQYGGRVTFRPNPGVSISTNIQRNKVTLPQGSFDADVYEVEMQWNPTTWVAATTQVQFDDVSQLVGLFARIRWIVKPGNDVYFVYTHNWQNLGAGILDNRDLITLSRGGSIKMNYTYRF